MNRYFSKMHRALFLKEHGPFDVCKRNKACSLENEFQVYDS